MSYACASTGSRCSRPISAPNSRLPVAVHTVQDVVKGIMAGAQVVMMTSALLKRGIDYLEILNPTC